MNKLLIIFLLISSIVYSQSKKTKIGLVLSGGGAKGFAHVGVLKQIEKSGLQIDYIGGTSMGAIVGGLYAAGYSANQIEKIILDTDFFTLLQDKHKRRDLSFLKKEIGEKTSLTFPIINGGLSLPIGFSKGQHVLSFLSYLLSPVDNITDFSKLPIPFFCVATDIERGEEVLLEKGSLPLALRASGSFPTLLSPVEVDGKMLVDGGVLNNFPTDIMKSKGVDLIIGVDVQGEKYSKHDLNSATDILAQIVSFKMYEKNDKQIKRADVYIKPNVDEYTVVSFADSDDILKKGDTIAFEYRAKFDSLAKIYPIRYKRFPLEVDSKKFLVKEIRIYGNNNYTRAYVLGNLKLKEGDSVSYKNFTKKINKLAATDNFKKINYRFINTLQGKVLELDIIESKIKSKVKLGVHYDEVYKSGVLINFTRKNILSKNDLFSADLVIGDRLRYELNYFVDNGFYYSYGLKSRVNSSITKISVLNDFNEPTGNIDLSYYDFSNTFFVQTAFNKNFAFGIGAEHKYIHSFTSSIIDEDGNPYTLDDNNYLNAISYLKLDTFDDKNFPTKGIYFNGNFRWYLWGENKFINSDLGEFVQFSQLTGTFSFASTIAKKLIFQYTSDAGLTLGSVEAPIFDFRLGGSNLNFINTFVPFYGYDVQQLYEQSFLKSTFQLRYEFVKKNYINFTANYARVETNVFENFDVFSNIKSGYALGYSIDTFLGPVEIKYAWSPEVKKGQVYFNLGYWF